MITNSNAFRKIKLITLLVLCFFYQPNLYAGTGNDMSKQIIVWNSSTYSEVKNNSTVKFDIETLPQSEDIASMQYIGDSRFLFKDGDAEFVLENISYFSIGYFGESKPDSIKISPYDNPLTTKEAIDLVMKIQEILKSHSFKYLGDIDKTSYKNVESSIKGLKNELVGFGKWASNNFLITIRVQPQLINNNEYDVAVNIDRKF